MRTPLRAITCSGNRRERSTGSGRRHCTETASDARRRHHARENPAAENRRDDTRRRGDNSARSERGRDSRRGGNARPRSKAPKKRSTFEYFSEQSFGDVHDQLPVTLCDGSLAGAQRPYWTPNVNTSPFCEPSLDKEDGAIRRRMQTTYRCLCENPSIQFMAIDLTEGYIALLCGRCGRRTLTEHGPACIDVRILTGAFCPFCHATLTDRNDFGSHCRACWAHRTKPRSISIVPTCFREDKEIKVVHCPFDDCDFAAHIYGVWNVHTILHQYVRTLGNDRASIFLGEPRDWIYNAQADTYTPPLAILRAVGSAVIWLRSRHPEIEIDYAFDYEFPAQFPRSLRRPGPRRAELPKIEDIMPFLPEENFVEIAPLTIDEIREKVRERRLLQQVADRPARQAPREAATQPPPLRHPFGEAARETPAAASVAPPQDVDYRLPTPRDVDMRTPSQQGPISQRMLSRALAEDRDQTARAAHDLNVALSTAFAGASVSSDVGADGNAVEQRVRWGDVTDETAAQMVAETEEAALPPPAPLVVHNMVIPCKKRWHRHTSRDEPCKQCDRVELAREKRKARLAAAAEAETTDASAATTIDLQADDVEVDETLLADDAGDDTASHVSDETFEEIDQQLAYDSGSHQGGSAGNAAQTAGNEVTPPADRNAEAGASENASTETAGALATTTAASTTTTAPPAVAGAVETDTADATANNTAAPSTARKKPATCATMTPPTAESRSKTTSPFGRRVSPGAGETVSKRPRRQQVHLSLPTSPTAGDRDERVGIFNFEARSAPRVQPPAQPQDDVDLFPTPPRRLSAETPPYVENLSLDPRFAALLGSPDAQDAEAAQNTGGGNDPTSADAVEEAPKTDGGNVPINADAEEAAATSDTQPAEQQLERPMEVASDDIFSTPASSPAPVDATAAHTGDKSATGEATPPQAAQADTSPPPAEEDAAEAAFRAERDPLRTPPPLVIDAALQELAAAAHDVSDSEQEAGADASAAPIEALTQAPTEPAEALTQASPERATSDNTQPAGNASRRGREGPTRQRPANNSRRRGEGLTRQQMAREITLSVHNILTREPCATTDRSTQWYPSRAMMCEGNDGEIHRVDLRAEFPGQTAVPWRFVAHLPRPRQWSLHGMEEAQDILQEAEPGLEALYAGPMINIRGGEFLGRRAMYILGDHHRWLVRGHVRIWFADDARPINGYMSDTVAPCVPEMDHCEINIHLHEVYTPYQRAATLHFMAERLGDVARHDVLVIVGYNLRAILTKCF